MWYRVMRVTAAAFTLAAASVPGSAQSAPAKPRARDLGLPIGGNAGPLDAITDVAGVEVGHTTLISGSGKLVVGKGPVRTGVTVIHPRGKGNPDPVFGAWFTLNGNGEMTGTTWLQESGILEGPNRDHKHAQCWCRARRHPAVAGRQAWNAAVGVADRCRDL